VKLKLLQKNQRYKHLKPVLIIGVVVANQRTSHFVMVHIKIQPFCDGAHKDTGFEPVAFEITEAKEVALCQCKRTSTPPFCDGAHTRM